MTFDAIFTDPSEELADVAAWLHGVHKRGSCYEAFAEAMGLASGCAAFYDALSAITTRASHFEELVRQLRTSNPKMTANLERELAGAARQIMQFFAPANLGQPWTDGAREAAQRAQTWFEAGSPLVSSFVRLKVFPEARRLELARELKEAQQALSASPGPETWEDLALIHGMGRLIVMLEAFPFFGYAVVEQQSINVAVTTNSAALRAQSSGEERLAILRTVAVATAAVLSFVGAVNTFDDTMTSAGHLLQWARGEDPYGLAPKAISGPSK